MIGVIATEQERWAVSEFFELFKTPWEWYQDGRRYEVILCSGVIDCGSGQANIVLKYSAKMSVPDGNIKCVPGTKQVKILHFDGNQIPIYGPHLLFKGAGRSSLTDKELDLPAMYHKRTKDAHFIHVGYNLFEEVAALLVKGQPASYAHIPALERHIALLRSLILANGGTLQEISPVPFGYRFIACLTHDIDHPLLRNHKFDQTALGFFYRASIGSIREVMKGRRRWSYLLRNLKAVVKVPFVHLRIADDFWSTFDRYHQLEGDIKSSFFVIPFKGRAGRNKLGNAPRRRAAGYSAKELHGKLQTLIASGSEIGVHGIDAWVESSSAAEELEEIRRIVGKKNLGVRMHWLYFNEGSPRSLELGGAAYDSTVGYNETIGYRAGTTQVYRPYGASRLLELPLHIMDTALFYPSYLNLSQSEAMDRVSEIIDNAVQYGGCVTVNWHDRSIAPERCWDDAYSQLLEQLRGKGAWFGTAEEVVNWFKWRRSLVFNGSAWVCADPEMSNMSCHLPGLVVNEVSVGRHRISCIGNKLDSVCESSSAGLRDSACA